MREFHEACRCVETRYEVCHRVRAAHESGRLDLLGMALETLPELARHLPALRELAVNTNSLTALPDGIGQLKRLQSLVVRAPRPAALSFATVT